MEEVVRPATVQAIRANPGVCAIDLPVRPSTACGLTSVRGLESLPPLQEKLCKDGHRAHRAIDLNVAVWTRMDQLQKKGRSPRQRRAEVLEARHAWQEPDISPRNRDLQVSAVSGERLDVDHDGSITLEEAFHHFCEEHCPRSTTMELDDIVEVLRKCKVLDGWLTPTRLQAFLLSLQGGCPPPGQRRIEPVPAGSKTLKYCHFEALVCWVAECKGLDAKSVVEKLVNLARKVSHQSKREKLHMVFEMYAKKHPRRIQWMELVMLCQKLGVFEKTSLGVADIYLLFKDRGCEVQGASFSEYLNFLEKVAERLHMSGIAFTSRICRSFVDEHDEDDPALSWVRLKIKLAATTSTGRNWDALMQTFDADHSGRLTWDEFHQFCRTSLKLKEKTAHLRLVFDILDEDQSDEVTLQELIHFVERTAPRKTRPVSQ